jgi:hypothetical protein
MPRPPNFWHYDTPSNTLEALAFQAEVTRSAVARTACARSEHRWMAPARLAMAMIDRLMHHGEAIAIQGDSFRTKDAARQVVPSPVSIRVRHPWPRQKVQ